MIKYGVYSNMIYVESHRQQLINNIDVETINNRLQLIAVGIKPL